MVAGRTIRVIAATQSNQVYEILRRCDNVKYDIALYTGTIKELLPGAQLLIIDYEDVVEYPLAEADVREFVFNSGIIEYSSKDFVADWERIIRLAGGGDERLQNYCIAFVSYSGGTGRTTLALDTALTYAAAMKKQDGKAQQIASQPATTKEPVLMVEMTFGVSSLVSLTGVDAPRLYDLVTQTDAQVQTYKGISLVPMDYENACLLSTDLLQRFVQREMKTHRLTVIDCVWPHSLINPIQDQVNLWVIVASERQDAVANAVKLRDELRRDVVKEAKIWLTLNQASKAALDKDVGEVKWELKLPRIARPDEYRGDLGRVILSRAFPEWQEYNQPRRSGWLR